MAEVAGLVGVGLQLGKTAIDLYSLFAGAQEFGSDYDGCSWQIAHEENMLKRWEEYWGGGGGTLDQKLHPSDRRYRHAVGTLARIVSLFASAESLNSKYGVKSTLSPAPTQNTKGSATRKKRDRIPEFFRYRKNPGAVTALGSNVIKILQNPKKLLDQNLVSGLDDEIIRIENATKQLQEMLPLYKKMKWVIADKAKFMELIKQLRRYNKGLYELLPVPEQTAQPTPPAPPVFPRFNVPLQLLVQRNKKFVGRVDLLDKLHKILDPSQNQNQRTRRVAVLHGLGGMGKTQIVTEYAYRNSSSYTSVFWVDATSKATLAHSSLAVMEQIISHYRSKWHDSAPDFAEIEAVLGLPGFIKSTGEIHEKCPPELVTRAVKGWLSNLENDKWLIVFDNHDDFESVKMLDFFPSCDFGSIIISTRRPEIAKYGVGIEIGGIGEVSGISILLSSAGKDPGLSNGPDYDEASKIAERLGYLPLALDQAGGYISAMNIQFSEYIPLFNTNFRNLASANDPQLSEMYRNDTLFTTWKISFDRLPPSASNLLALCAFLVNGNQEVPQEIFDRAKGFVSWFPTESDFIDIGIKSLLSFSMAKRKTYQNEKSLCFHPLILEWTRDNLGLLEERTFTMRAIAVLAGCIRSTNSGVIKNDSAPNAVFEREVFPYIDVVVRHLRELPAPSMMVLEVEFANALVEIGIFLVNYSRYTEAEEVLQRSLEFHEEIANHEPMIYQRDYHRALSNLGWIFYTKQQFERSIGFFERALSGEEHMFGKDTLETVETMGRMSIVLNAQTNHSSALVMQDRVIACYERFRGDEHPDTLNAMQLKGELLGRDGNQEAVELLQRTLSGQEKTLGKSHSSTLRTIKALALAIQMQGPTKSPIALELYKGVLATQEEVLGPQHPETINTVYAMAFSYRNNDQQKEALISYERVLESWKTEFGIEHPDTLGAIQAVAEIYQMQQRYQEALELHQQALVAREAVFGTESTNTCATLYGISQCLHGLGKYGEAAYWYKRVLAIQERALGDDNIETLRTIRGLVHSLHEDGKRGESFALLERILHAQERALGKNHPETLLIRYEMAHNIAAREGHQEALNQWEDILAMQEDVLIKDHPHVLSSVSSIAMAMKHLGRYQEAIEFFKRALAGQERIYGPNDLIPLRTLWSLAIAKNDNGDYEEALELIQRSLTGMEKILGKEHPEILVIVATLASFLSGKGQYQEAAELYKRVLSGRRKLFGQNHEWTISTAVDLSEVEAKLQ
ncbi:hypothetical protein DFP73DRAFT_34814 [Morchella snyderi]|nr:hypothetical protein DFP73DRAFT_34814 [Morchella snyderi]